MKIALVEFESFGHHYLLYLKTIIEALKKTNVTTYVVLGEEIKKITKLSNTKNIKYIFVKRLKYPDNKNTLNFIFFQIRSFFFLKNIYKKKLKKLELDHIYLNNLDHFEKILSIIGSPFEGVNFSGIFLNPKIIKRNFFDFKNIIHYFFFKQILKIKTLTKVAVTNPLVYKEAIKKKLKKLELLNEISSLSGIKINFTKENSTLFKKKIGIKNEDIILLMYGNIRLEKGIEYLSNAMLNERFSNKIKVIIAGKQNIDFYVYLTNLIKKNPRLKKKIIIYNKIVSNHYEKLFFKISNYTWVGYNKNFLGSSAVLFLSSSMNVPVIGGDVGLISYYIKKYKIGYYLNLEDTETLVNFFNNLKNRNKFALKKFSTVNKAFTKNMFQKTILKQLMNVKKF